jgi:ankyrin repeat protein
LHEAAERRHIEIVELLLAKGADINATDMNGQTPLMYSLLHEPNATTEILLARGCSVNVLSKGGETALDFAELFEMKELLRSYGAKRGKELQEEDK